MEITSLCNGNKSVWCVQVSKSDQSNLNFSSLKVGKKTYKEIMLTRGWKGVTEGKSFNNNFFPSTVQKKKKKEISLVKTACVKN